MKKLSVICDCNSESINNNIISNNVVINHYNRLDEKKYGHLYTYKFDNYFLDKIIFYLLIELQ